MHEQLQTSTLTVPVDDSRDHIIGPGNAPVTLLEYGDFECPHCRTAHFILDELMPRIDEMARLAFRHFPLTQIHPHSQRAAEAAEAAGSQGQFWEMHDLLFENQDALADDDLMEYAEAIGLDLERFESDVGQHSHLNRIREDVVGGIRNGVNGTPTFFINGLRHDGSFDQGTLSAAAADAATKTGTRVRVRVRGK